MTVLYLDDQRNPFLPPNHLHYESLVKNLTTVVWVRSYVEFTDWIKANGLPDAICFDHDLANIHYGIICGKSSWDAYYEKERDFNEYTGYDAAKWLSCYCQDNKLTIPKWRIQSLNPIGRDNIDNLLNNHIKHNQI